MWPDLRTAPGAPRTMTVGCSKRMMADRIVVAHSSLSLAFSHSTIEDTGNGGLMSAPGRYLAEGVAIRPEPRFDTEPVGYGYTSHAMTLLCWTNGDFGNENNPIWRYHRNDTTGVTGYSHANYTSSAPIPDCSRAAANE